MKENKQIVINAPHLSEFDKLELKIYHYMAVAIMEDVDKKMMEMYEREQTENQNTKGIL